MMGRLSFEGTVARGRSWADDAVGSQGWGRQGPGPGTEMRESPAARQLDGGILRPWAPIRCLVRGVYTTRVQTVFRLADSGNLYKVEFSRRYAGILRIPDQVYGDDLGECSASGRPIVVGVFHELSAPETAPRAMPGECASGHTGTA
ncbi:hypothetical protein RGQ21_64070 [Kitasatospora aureofaciens]|nr:hypothetical protein RGQ21_64070 [Kitasatospora aureofaciens]